MFVFVCCCSCFYSSTRVIFVIFQFEDQSAVNKAVDSVKKLGQAAHKPVETVTENDAFEGIGDEDL
uniref:Uncharacterized protein n=1 Tax=Arion vulgaris TaxID=1028688 RepID=A0A0B6ZXM2_9EUPU